MTDIGLLVRSANPVPDDSQQLTDDELSAVLLLVHQRSADMDAKELTRSVEKEPRNRRSEWYVAAVAFALVTLLIGSVVLLNRGSDPDIPPATTPSTTQAAASTTEPDFTPTIEPTTTTAAPTLDVAAVAFVEALVDELNAGDKDAVGSRLGSVGELAHTGGGSDTTLLVPYLQFWMEIDSAVEVLGCRRSDDGTTRCDVERYSDAEPFAPLPWTGQFQVRRDENSMISLTLMGFESDPWHVEYEAFLRWIRENHPDELWLVYNNVDPVQRAEAQARFLEEYLAQSDG